MDLLKKLTHHHDHKDHKPDSSDASPAHSTTSTEDQATQTKYLNDPMRTTTHGDTVGHFTDPMGGRANNTGAGNYDPTNTGA